MAPRVLVVEDNPVNLELLVALLEQEGCEVLVAETADAGLHLAKTARPALILMDVQLPGMTGYEATCHLKADPATATIPVIALPALAMRGEEERAKTAGCATPPSNCDQSSRRRTAAPAAHRRPPRSSWQPGNR